VFFSDGLFRKIFGRTFDIGQLAEGDPTTIIGTNAGYRKITAGLPNNHGTLCI